MHKKELEAPLARRQLLQLLGLGAVGGAALAACGGGPGGSTQGGAAPNTSGPVKGNVSFAHWRAEDKEIFDKIIANFAKANAGVTVRQDISPSNDYQSTALQKIRGGAIGDVFTAFRGAQFVDMVSAGLYSDLSSQSFAGNYESKFLDVGKGGGKQMGLPYQLVFNMPVVNKDLLTRSGISSAPADWDGFLAMCKKLKDAGVVPIAWPGGDAGNAGQLLNAMVMNNAPSDDMFAKIESGEYKTTDDWFVKTLEQYAQLRPYFQPNSTGTAVEPAQQLFASGKAAMLATGSFHFGAIRKLGAQFAFDLLAPITVSADKAKYMGIHNATFILGTSTASHNQAAAVKFLAYLSQPDVATVYANESVQHSTVTGVTYTNSDLKATQAWLSKKTLLAPRFQFKNLDLRAAVENAAVKVVGGADPAKAAADAQHVVDQQRK
jgi:raffinose/stachyose/melibiose transport system substrate-binding protein